jgi:hypothetical protein
MFPGAVLLADYAGTLDVSNRVEVRARVTENPPANLPPIQAPVSSLPVGTPITFGSPVVATNLPNLGFDLVDIPTLRLDLKQYDWEYILDYSAFAILPDLELGPPTPQVLQSGDVGIIWQDRRVRLGLTQYGQYGEQNSAYLATPVTTGTSGTTPPVGGSTVQLLAAPETVTFGASRTDLTSRIHFSRLWLGTGLLEYSIQGGLDASSRTALPIVKGPRADVTLAYSATRLDTIETRFAGATSIASIGLCSPTLLNPFPIGAECQPEAGNAQVTLAWRRRLSRHSEAWIGAGPSLVVARLRPSDSYTEATYPAAIGGFQYLSSVEQVRTVLRFDAQIAPLVDVRTGIIDDRAQGTLTLSLPFRDLTVTGSASGSRSIDPLFAEPVTSALGSFEVDYRIERYLSLGGGVRYAWQDQATLGAFSSGLLFVQATVRAPTVRF